MACCVIGTAPATWQQARWPSRLLDSSSHCDDDVWPHSASPWPPRASTMPVDVPTYLGMSPRLRRASWAATKAARSRGMSPATAPNPTARHWPCDAPNTSNDVFVPLGTSLGAPNARLTTPRWAETAHPTAASRPATACPLWMCHDVSGHPDTSSGPSTAVHQPGTWLQPCLRPHDLSPPL